MATVLGNASSVSGALKSILGTVTTTANSVSSLVNVGGKSIGMLDAFVTQAATDQEIQHLKHREDFITNLIRTSAEEQATANMQVMDFCKKSADHKAQFEQSFDRYSKLFARYRPSESSEAE